MVACPLEGLVRSVASSQTTCVNFRISCRAHANHGHIWNALSGLRSNTAATGWISFDTSRNRSFSVKHAQGFWLSTMIVKPGEPWELAAMLANSPAVGRTSGGRQQMSTTGQ